MVCQARRAFAASRSLASARTTTAPVTSVSWRKGTIVQSAGKVRPIGPATMRSTDDQPEPATADSTIRPVSTFVRLASPLTVQVTTSHRRRPTRCAGEPSRSMACSLTSVTTPYGSMTSRLDGTELKITCRRSRSARSSRSVLVRRCSYRVRISLEEMASDRCSRARFSSFSRYAASTRSSSDAHEGCGGTIWLDSCRRRIWRASVGWRVGSSPMGGGAKGAGPFMLALGSS